MSVPIHRLKVLAETCVFVKQSLGPFHCGPVLPALYTPSYLGHPLSRSYGVNLPSSLTTAHSSTLEYSSHLPVSVCGTVTTQSPIRGFSRQHAYVELWPIRAPYSSLGDNSRADLPTRDAYGLKPASNSWPDFTPASPLIVRRLYSGTGILNLFPIGYAFRPRLRIRLTLRRLTLLRKP